MLHVGVVDWIIAPWKLSKAEIYVLLHPTQEEIYSIIEKNGIQECLMRVGSQNTEHP